MSKRSSKKNKLDNNKHKVFRVKYGGKSGVSVFLPYNPRQGVCKICGKSVENGDIKFTNLHHVCYEFRPSTVKKAADEGDYSLALKNTIEVDFYCHRFMDSLRTILSVEKNRFINGTNYISKKQKDEFAKLCRMYLKHYKSNKKNKKEKT